MVVLVLGLIQVFVNPLGQHEFRRLPPAALTGAGAGSLLPLVCLHNSFRYDMWSFANVCSDLSVTTFTPSLATHLLEWWNWVFFYQLEYHHHHEDDFWFAEYRKVTPKQFENTFRNLQADHIKLDKYLSDITSVLQWFATPSNGGRGSITSTSESSASTSSSGSASIDERFKKLTSLQALNKGFW